MALKEQLKAKMKEKREQARQQRQEMYDLDNEEGGFDVDEEEAEMSDRSDTDVEDEEADDEEFDGEEEVEDDGDLEEDNGEEEEREVLLNLYVCLIFFGDGVDLVQARQQTQEMYDLENEEGGFVVEGEEAEMSDRSDTDVEDEEADDEEFDGEEEVEDDGNLV